MASWLDNYYLDRAISYRIAQDATGFAISPFEAEPAWIFFAQAHSCDPLHDSGGDHPDGTGPSSKNRASASAQC
ncbi:hypothetical protein MJO29_003011 [Puccinia striiformis f. sp. tritici]|nr:hypothetical protein MJO29_003011 [Puccinia striiformis f. sp. tritici]